MKEIGELIIILSMIYEEISERDKLHENLFEEPINEYIFERYNILNSRLKIHYKAIYLWLYNLKILIDRHPQKDLLVTGENKLYLDKYCEFRHKLISHKQSLKTVPLGGVVHKKDQFDFQIIMTPLKVPENAIKEVNNIFKSYKSFLSDEESSELNFHRRLEILYKNLHKFGERKKDVLDLIEKYGTYSDPPIILIEFIRDLCNDLIPKLINCNPNFDIPSETSNFFNQVFD